MNSQIIKKYTPFNKGILIDCIDYNKAYYYILYSSWNYNGNPNDSKNFYLHPKERIDDITDIIKIQATGKNKGRMYLDDSMFTRWYLPKKLQTFLEENYYGNRH